MPRHTRSQAEAIEVRLFDRLRAYDPALNEIPILVADEIGAQIDALPSTGQSAPAESYGIVAPPFPAFFVEADTTVQGVGICQRGVFVRDITPIIPALTPAIRQTIPEGTRWMMMMMGYISVPSKPIASYNGAVLIHLDETGRLLDDTEQLQITGSLPAGHATLPPNLLPLPALAQHVPYALKAIGALHQRTIAEHVTPSSAAQRRARKAGIPQLHSYYVLRVKPTPQPQNMRDVGQALHESGTRRAHAVRGHFRYYSEAAPLFGRHVGAVWIPDHSRGDDAIGTIQKDYEV